MCAVAVECYWFFAQSARSYWLMGKTLHEHKFEQPSDGRITPCGATVEYHPMFPKDQAKLHHFDNNVEHPGLFNLGGTHFLREEAGRDTYPKLTKENDKKTFPLKCTSKAQTAKEIVAP